MRVIPGLDARLALIDAIKNHDKYYVLQVLENPGHKAPKNCFSYQRWGRTGTSGQAKMQGPVDEAKAAGVIKKVFKSKTGAAWGTVSPGHKAKPGKYWLQNASQAN